jgi:Photosynthesis system II assembly factor YCF48
MKITIAAVAGFGIATLAVTAAIPAHANPQSRSHRGPVASQSVAAVASATCHRKPSPATFVTAHSLDAVQFVSSTTGWVAGADRVLATTDGGAHWSLQRSAPRADFTEVDAIDGDHAWIVGRRQLIATTNGGASWRTLPEPCPVISSVHFYSAKRGVAVAGGNLLKTSDGGARWRTMHAPAAVQSVCFTNSQSGWLGAHGQIYRTVSAGRRWIRVVVGQKPRSRRNPPLADVQCAGPNAGWAELIGPGVGLSNQQHVGYSLNDHGSRAIFAEQYFQGPHSTITRNSPGPEFGAFSAVDESDAVFIDTCAPCNAGTSPMAIATNEGHSWTVAGKVGHIDLATGAGFASTSDGWVVGETLHANTARPTWKIVHTINAGESWVTQYSQ